MRSRAEKFGVKVYAYCIMSNHVHILLKSDFKVLSLFMQEVNSIYAIYHNYKHGESGHVFQGRFYTASWRQRDICTAVSVIYIIIR